MPEPLVSLSKCTIICPIKLFKSTILFPWLHFGPVDHDSSKKHHICYVVHKVLPCLYTSPKPKMPILFNILGQIAVENCFLTTWGCLWPSNEEPIASCWLQQCPNIVSDLTWCSILPAIKALIDEYAVTCKVNTSKLLIVGVDGKLQLQVIWQGEVGEVSTSFLLPLELNAVC